MNCTGLHLGTPGMLLIFGVTVAVLLAVTPGPHKSTTW